MALAMATAAAAAAFSTPQARRRRSRKHRRRYCDHNCDDASGRYRRGSVNGNEGIGDDGSYLTLDVREMVIDADPGSGGSGGRDVVTLSWHITEDVNPLDWIGLYFAGEKNPFRYLDYRSHGLRCQTSGHLQWRLNGELFGRKTHAKIRFKYYDGLNGNLRAISPVLSLTLINQKRRRASEVQQGSLTSQNEQDAEKFLNITIKEISCEGLRKSIIPPQFYVHTIFSNNNNDASTSAGDPSSTPSFFKTKPVGSLHPRWTDLAFEYKMLPISSSSSLRFVIKDKNRPRFYRITAQGSISTSDICTYMPRLDSSYTDDIECAFCVDMNLTRLSAAPSPSRASNGTSSTNKNECRLSILARIGMASKLRSTATTVNDQSSINNGNTAIPAGSSSNPQSDPVISGISDKSRIEMQQQQGPSVAPTAAFVTTPSVSSASFSSASSAGSSGSSSDAGCSKCGLHRVPRLKHSDSGISQSSGEQSHVKSSLPKPEPAPSSSSGIATTVISNAVAATGVLHNSQTSPSPIRFRRSATNSGIGYDAIRPRSLPHTPIKSPRLRRPDTLNVVCACCLTNANLNVNTGVAAEGEQQPDQQPSTPQLAMVLKNANTASCRGCAELRTRWAFASSSASSSANSTKPGAPGSSSGVSSAPLATEDATGSSPFGGSSGSASASSTSSKRQTVQNYVDILPPFWEARVDSHGRVFYVDHLNKTTTWERPCGPNRVKQVEQARRHLIDKRYMCMRKTVGSAVGRVEVPEGDYSKWPAVIFLTRPDFMMFLHSNDVAKDIYCKSQSVRHIIHRVRKDPSKFERYQYNKDIVSLLNEFADKSAGMPLSWEAKLDPGGREFFVDHKNKRTTFIDPRLPMPSAASRRRRTRSAPSETDDADTSLTYNERVVNFMRRPDAMETMCHRHAALRNDSKLKRKIATICKVGVPALKKFANDVDLITLLSVCEEDILSESMSSSTSKTFSLTQDEFDTKLTEFYERLQQKGYGQGPGKLRISTRREHLLKDAFEQVMAASRKDLQRNKLNIVFDDEEGLDYGGPSREFFFLISRELFNPYYGLFEYSANDTYTVQISAMSVFVDNYIEWFQFCGRILGLALIHRFLLDTFFTRAFYKFLLRIPCSVSDLESLDNQFYTSLLWLHENPVTPDLGLTFSVNEEIGGELMERELKTGGNMIAVTEENKQEYVERMVKWRLERGVKKQANSLLKGFYEVIDPQLVRIFDARELELVLAGTIEIDIGDWRTNTEYRGGYHDDHIVILWFWQTVERFTNAQRLLLLQFVTGTSSIPYEGFSALRGSHGPKRFTIEKWGSPAGLPRAHTCFNRLDLPPYTSFAALSQKLLTAIEESSSFGIE